MVQLNKTPQRAPLNSATRCTHWPLHPPPHYQGRKKENGGKTAALDNCTLHRRRCCAPTELPKNKQDVILAWLTCQSEWCTLAITRGNQVHNAPHLLPCCPVPALCFSFRVCLVFPSGGVVLLLSLYPISSTGTRSFFPVSCLSSILPCFWYSFFPVFCLFFPFSCLSEEHPAFISSVLLLLWTFFFSFRNPASSTGTCISSGFLSPLLTSYLWFQTLPLLEAPCLNFGYCLSFQAICLSYGYPVSPSGTLPFSFFQISFLSYRHPTFFSV